MTSYASALLRTLPAVSLLAAGCLLVTGCQGGSSATGSSGDSASSAEPSIDGTYKGWLSVFNSGELHVDRRFFSVSGSTEVLGSGGICGDAAAARTRCTTEELEAAAKARDVRVAVTMVSGIATKVVELDAEDTETGVQGGTDD